MLEIISAQAKRLVLGLHPEGCEGIWVKLALRTEVPTELQKDDFEETFGSYLIYHPTQTRIITNATSGQFCLCLKMFEFFLP